MLWYCNFFLNETVTPLPHYSSASLANAKPQQRVNQTESLLRPMLQLLSIAMGGEKNITTVTEIVTFNAASTFP